MNEQTIKDIYKIAGMLEMLTCMQDQPLTSGMVAELVDAVDKLELIGAEMMNALNEPIMPYITGQSDLIDFFDEKCIKLHGPIEKVVNAHEEAAESPPEALQPDQ